MYRSARLRWIGVLVLVLALSGLGCITAEIGIEVIPIEGEQNQVTVHLSEHLTEAYMEAARSANAERAQDYQAASLPVPGDFWPESFFDEWDSELGDLSPLADWFNEGGEADSVKKSVSGYNIVHSITFEGDMTPTGESAAELCKVLDVLSVAEIQPLGVSADRADPERIHTVITLLITDVTSSELGMVYRDRLDQLRAEGLGPKPVLSAAGTPGAGAELDEWYEDRLLLLSGLPTVSYWIELPGEITSSEIDGRPAGTLSAAKNRVTLEVDEDYLRQHPEGAAGIWRIESVMHTCQLECGNKPYMIWNQVSAPGECICECASGWALGSSGDACVREFGRTQLLLGALLLGTLPVVVGATIWWIARRRKKRSAEPQP